MATVIKSAASDFISQQVERVGEGRPRESYAKIRDAHNLTADDYSNLHDIYIRELDADAPLQELAFVLTPLLRASIMQGVDEETRQQWIDSFGEKMLEKITFEPKPADKQDTYGQPPELMGLSELYEQIGYLRGTHLKEEQQLDYEARLARASAELADRAVEAGYTPAVVFVHQGKGNRTTTLQAAILDSYDKHADSFASYEDFQRSIGRCLNNRPSFTGSNEDTNINAAKRKALNEKILLADDNAPLSWMAQALGGMSEFSGDKPNPALQEKFDAQFATVSLEGQYNFFDDYVADLASDVYAHKAFKVMTANVIKKGGKQELSVVETDVLENAATYVLNNIERQHSEFLPVLRVLTRLGEGEIANRPLEIPRFLESETHPAPERPASAATAKATAKPAPGEK